MCVCDSVLYNLIMLSCKFWLNVTVWYLFQFGDHISLVNMTTLVHNIIDGYHDLMENKSGKLIFRILSAFAGIETWNLISYIICYDRYF